MRVSVLILGAKEAAMDNTTTMTQQPPQRQGFEKLQTLMQSGQISSSLSFSDAMSKYEISKSAAV